MAKKVLKKKTQRKAAVVGAAGPVMESAREIWLAGLGAFSVAQQESGRILEHGSRLFERLVAEGGKLESKARKDFEVAVSDLRGGVESRMGDVRSQADSMRKQAADNWDKLEKIFEDRVAKALARLGIPSREDINSLAAKVETLARQVSALSGAAPARPKGAAGSRNVTRAKATGNALSRTAANPAEPKAE